MLTVKPFRALVPPPDKAADVSAVPYDVVNTDEARKLAEGNSLSFLHVSRPDINLPEGTDLHSEEAYAEASAAFERLCAEAPLTHDDQPHYYVYSVEREGHRQSGLAAAVGVDDYDEDRVMQHEKTRPEKVADRTRHLMATRTHSGPVFLVCKSMWSMDSTVQEVMAKHTPVFDITANDGTIHQIWRVPALYNRMLEEVFRRCKRLYIADGHHRAKSASEAKKECQAANPQHTGTEDYNRFLCVIFPDNQLKILAYNRAVHDLNGMSADEFMERLKTVGELTPTTTPNPTEKGYIGVYIKKAWYSLNLSKLPAATNPVDQLDVSLLQNSVLAPILGIDDPRTSTRIDFVGGIRGTAWLEHLVDSGKAEVAFAMYPTTVDELIMISEAGEVMPPKSTWFEPKLRDGLLIHTF